MGSSWTGFDPQNEIVKLQWAVLEASQLNITAQELARMLAIIGLKEPPEEDQLLGGEGLGLEADS